MSAEPEKCPVCGVEMRIHPLLCRQDNRAHCAVASGSASGFLELLAGVVEAERLVVAGLKPEMPCRKMHENRHRAFREALSMATAYFQPNNKDVPTRDERTANPSK